MYVVSDDDKRFNEGKSRVLVIFTFFLHERSGVVLSNLNEIIIRSVECVT